VDDSSLSRPKSREEQASPRIGLALSGGGFRATLFHLGVLKLLRERSLLGNVRYIASVSGGSITAAHFALRRIAYVGTEAEYASAEKELRLFIKQDIRGRIIRRWLLSLLFIVPSLIRSKIWSPSRQLIAAYDHLLKGAQLENLPSQLELELDILSTSMTTGESFSFGRPGVHFTDRNESRFIPTATLPVAFAVAASSAFPPLFAPVQLDDKVLLCDKADFPNPQFLTDGGIHDNLGIQALIARDQRADDLDFLIVSDAEGNFDWTPGRDYSWMVSRNIRASDMLMRRISLLQYASATALDPKLVKVSIGTEVDDDSSRLDPGSQRALRNVRTDLDCFSELEIESLVAHGYAVANQVIARKLSPPNSPPRADSKLRWSLRDVKASQKRKWRLFSSSDGVTWITICVLAGYLLLPILPLAIQSRQIEVLTAGAERAADYASLFVRHDNQNSKILIFVHGIFGNPVDSWRCRTSNTTWPELVQQDTDFDGFDIYSAGYASQLLATNASIADLAERLYLRLSAEGALDAKYQSVDFVVHSLGGLVVKDMLLKHHDTLKRVDHILQFGVPTTGSRLARLGGLFSSQAQVLAPSDTLANLDREWKAVATRPQVRCAYETIPIHGTIVVDGNSATASCDGPSTAIDADHVRMVQPCSKDSISHLLLRQTMLAPHTTR
jgi:predicted acylesterase/phospholipase RssA